MRESLETSISAALELGVLDAEGHAAAIEGARRTADELDASSGGRGMASLLSTHLAYCKALGIVPTQAATQEPVTGEGRLAKMRARSSAGLRAV